MGFLLYTIHVVVSIFLILVVLLQQGKGADLSVFGGGSTMTAFGARGAASLLHKLTVGGFVVFIVTTLAIGVYQTSHSDSVIQALPSAEEAAAEALPGADTAAGSDEAEADLTGVLPEAEEFVSPSEGEGTGASEGEGDGAAQGADGADAGGAETGAETSEETGG